MKEIMTGMVALFVGVVAMTENVPAYPPKDPATENNPLFDAWKGLKNQELTFHRKTWISGGAPPGDKRLASETTVTYKMAEVAADKATIAVAEKG